MPQQNVCILGGSGFVGTHLAARLVKQGHNVTVVTRNRERNRHLLVLPTINIVSADVQNESELMAHFNGCDAVINLIGILNQTRKQKFSDVHVELTAKIVNAAKAVGVKRILHVSALKADASKAPSDYLKTKGQAEDLLAQQSEVGITVFRPSVIFGREDSFINRFAFLLKIPSWWFMLPNPNTRFAPVYVSDVVSAMAHCLENPATVGETYELCGPRVLSLKEIVTFIRDQLGKDTKIIGLGQGLSKFAAWLLEWLPGKPMSVDNFRSMQVHNICSSNGFERMGITTTPMESVVPGMLADSDQKGLLSVYRRTAGR